MPFRRPSLIIGALVALVLVAPSAAAAPSITTPLACWNGAQPAPATFPVYGSGFPPGIDVQVGEADDLAQTDTDVRTDAAGSFTAQVGSSLSWTGDPRLITVTASQLSPQQPPPPPRLLASLQVTAVAATQTVDYAAFSRLRRPREHIRVIWSGGLGGTTVYAHFLYGRRDPGRGGALHAVKTRALGQLSGPCGGLDTSFAGFAGVKLKPGWWAIAVTTSKGFHWGESAPGLDYDVERWNGTGPRPYPHAHRGSLVIVQL